MSDDEASAAITTAAAAPTSAGKSALTLLRELEPQIRRALAGQLPADRFTRVIQTELRRQPNLNRANQTTLLAAMVTAAQLALDLTPGLGQAHLESRWNSRNEEYEVQLQIDYRGWVTLALRSGLVSAIEAHAVHAGDVFHYRYGLHPVLEHEPTNEDAGDVVCAWALAQLTDGAQQFRVLTRAELDKRRAASPSWRKAKKSGPWAEWEEEMAAKSAIKALVKQLPARADLAAAAAADGSVRTDVAATVDEWAEAEAEPELLPPAEESAAGAEPSPPGGDAPAAGADEEPT